MDLGICGGIQIPGDLFIAVDFGYAELMGEEHISIWQQNRVADFAFALRVVVRPDDFALSHDVNVARLRFAGVEEIVLRETFPRQL